MSPIAPDVPTQADPSGRFAAGPAGSAATDDATPSASFDAPRRQVDEAAARERRGRRWVVWSFILCPCHLPVTLGVLGAIFGGSAFGGLLSRYSWGVAIILTAIYVVALGIGLRHVRAAERVRACADGACDLPGS